MWKSGRLLSGVIVLLCSGQAVANTHSWSQASSVARTVVIAAALGIPSVQDDWTGTAQTGASVGSAFLLAEGLKQAIPEMRPDGSNRHSFPSAHTATAFAAAASLQNRYGWEAGLPAQLVATFVAVARVKARKHRWGDVAVGMAMGEATGFLITKRKDDRVKIFPWADGKGGGVALAFRF